jgi:tRNA threonylcarbamoyladenosine biosynthesis protein TsaB
MKILAFDTTNQTLSVAILFNENVVAKRNIFEASKQTELLIPLIEECLTSAKIWYQGLDLIAFTNGPGSFTGIRVGFSCAKSLQIATNLPIIAISSLEAIAYGKRRIQYKKIPQYKKILVVNDARLDELYIQEFDVMKCKITSCYETKLIKFDEVKSFFPKEKFLLLGSAKSLIKNLEENCIVEKEEDFISAVNIALLAKEIYEAQNNIEKAEALYIRQPKIGKRKKTER